MPRKSPRLPEFRKLFEHAPDGIIILSAENRQVLDANPKAAEMMGRRRDDLVNRRLADFVSQDLTALTEFTKAVTNHGVGWTDELSWPGKTGEPLPVEISASGFEGPGGRFLLLVLHPLPADRSTQRKDAAARARLQVARFQRQLDRFQQEVLNMTAHKFRTPLTPIVIQLEMLQRNLKTFLTPADQKAFDVIRRQFSSIEKNIEEVITAAAPRTAEPEGSGPARGAGADPVG